MNRRRRRWAPWLTALALLAPAIRAADPPPTRQVGSEIGFPPYADVDSHGQASGFAVALFSAVARTMDLPVAYRVSDWDTAWNGLRTGRLDALPVVARLKEREGLIEFTSTPGDLGGIPHPGPERTTGARARTGPSAHPSIAAGGDGRDDHQHRPSMAATAQRPGPGAREYPGCRPAGLDHNSARGTSWERRRPARTRARGPRSQEAGRSYDQGPPSIRNSRPRT